MIVTEAMLLLAGCEASNTMTVTRDDEPTMAWWAERVTVLALEVTNAPDGPCKPQRLVMRGLTS